MRRITVLALLATLVLLVVAATSALADTTTAARNSGYYDNQVIEYEGTVVTASSIQEAQLISLGNVVYHVVGFGMPSLSRSPAVQCARNTAAFPNDATDCNVLNAIPTDRGPMGYAGGAWNLQIFHWNASASPRELSSDVDILTAAANGEGWIQQTAILVRCPVVNFSNLR